MPGRWEGLANDYGVKPNTKLDDSDSSYDSGRESASDAIESARAGVMSAANLANRVNAQFRGEGDFAGGSVSGCVEDALGASVAEEFGLSQQAAPSVSMGMGGSSSPEDEEERK